jgi:hypothetical protein
LVLFVDGLAFGTWRASEGTADCDCDGDTHGQPDGDVARGHAQRRTNAGTESDAQGDLHLGFLQGVPPLEPFEWSRR